MEIDVSKLSAKELKALLAEKEKEEKDLRQAKKNDYEKHRNEMVNSVVERAQVLHNQMRDFKQFSIDKLEGFRELAAMYSDIRSNSKGGFSLRNADGDKMVSLDRNVVIEYDERASQAEELIKEFLEDKIKKRDVPTYKTIRALLDRNTQGDFTPGRIASLLKVKDNYDDERWVRAMQLFEESPQTKEISYSVSFYVKDEMSKDQVIVLSFPGIPIEHKAPEAVADDNG